VIAPRVILQRGGNSGRRAAFSGACAPALRGCAGATGEVGQGAQKPKWRKRTGIEPAEAVSPHPPTDLKSVARTSATIASEAEYTENDGALGSRRTGVP
jgi:hypothetical protein